MRQPGGGYMWQGELPPGTRKVRIVFDGQVVVPGPIYRVSYAVAMLERGPLKFPEYHLVPVRSDPLSPETMERLAALRRKHKHGQVSGKSDFPDEEETENE